MEKNETNETEYEFNWTFMPETEEVKEDELKYNDFLKKVYAESVNQTTIEGNYNFNWKK